jgi:hypothetical protein
MTKITTIYDTVRAALATILTGKLEIPNPYSLPDNPIQFLKNGYGVVIGDGTPGSFQVYCLDNEARTFTVILTREVYRLEVDNANLITESKNLLEDIRKVKNDMLANDQLAINETIQKIDYAGGSGINFVSAGKHNLIYADISFSIEYTETILES